MSTLVRIPLSGAGGASQIAVARITTPGNTVHTASPSTGVIDFVTLYANNISTTDRVLTLEKGGVSDGNTRKYTVFGQLGDQTIWDRVPMQSSMVLAAFAAASSVIVLDGWVDRYTP